jgi:SAM-dependent methyltransferase
MHEPTESYAGRHAQLYDLFYADKRYDQESAFVEQLLRVHGGEKVKEILEVACGTGSHAGILSSHGYSVVATDWSAAMLAEARRKFPNVDFQRQDMRNLDLGKRRFDAAVCLFDSIGYAQSNDQILNVLSGIHRHLKPGGLFVFEFWHAAAMIKSYEPSRVRKLTVGGREIVRVSNTTLDIPQQLATVEYTISEKGAGGESSFKEIQVNRFFLVQEMAVILASGGFEPLAWHSGFTSETPIDESTWHVVAVARAL